MDTRVLEISGDLLGRLRALAATPRTVWSPAGASPAEATLSEATDLATIIVNLEDKSAEVTRLRNQETLLNADLATLRAERIQSQEVILATQNELKASQDDFDVQSQALAAAQREMADQRAIAVALARNPPAPQDPSNLFRRPVTMSDPEIYLGDRDKLRPFLTQLHLKLGEQGSFPDVQSQLRYIIGRLGGPALDQVFPYVTPNGVNFDTVEACVRILTNAFDDPDRKGTAERRLDALQQKNREFTAYYAEFQRYAAELEWNSAAKRAALRRGISSELKDALVTIDEPEEFDSFVQLLQKRDSKLRARKAEQHRPASNTQFKSSQPPKTAPAPAALVPANPTASNSGYHGPAPMDLSSGAGKLTPAERIHRIQQGLCLYCGGSGHLAVNCPYKKPIGAAETVVQPVAPAPLQPRIEEVREEPAKN